MKQPNQGAAANGLSAARSSVAGDRERTVRSTAAPEAVPELVRRSAPIARMTLNILSISVWRSH